MPLLRRIRVAAAATALTGASLIGSTDVVGAEAFATAEPPPCGNGGPTLRYVVLFQPATSDAAAAQDVGRHCGSLTSYYQAIGVGVIDTSDPSFEQRIGSDRAYSAQGQLRAHDVADDQNAVNAGNFVSSDGSDRTGEQWNMAAIRAEQARTIADGRDNTVVGVLDSGIDPNHPELSKTLDPTRSADCLGGAPETTTQPWAPDESSHGTHVAGIIGAADDGQGITGIAPGVRLASIRVVDDEGYVHPEYAVCGFMWAAEKGIRVANSSFLVESAQQGCDGSGGSPVPREAVRRAVEYATSHGVLTVASVGNERIDLSTSAGRQRSNCDAVPAALNGVLSVSAVGQEQVKSGYSSYGLGAVDLTAPGGENRPSAAQPGTDRCVLSTVPDGYGTACGTSMAAPHVSGVAALVADQHPEAGPRELTRMLVERSKPMGCPTNYDLNADSMQDALCRGYASYNGFYGHGMVDALSAVGG